MIIFFKIKRIEWQSLRHSWTDESRRYIGSSPSPAISSAQIGASVR